MSSPGFQWRVRGLVRAALLDDSGQTNACCALLETPTRGPERLEGCAQPPHQQERTRPEVAGSARHQAAATRSESVKSTDRGKYIVQVARSIYKCLHRCVCMGDHGADALPLFLRLKPGANSYEVSLYLRRREKRRREKRRREEESFNRPKGG